MPGLSVEQRHLAEEISPLQGRQEDGPAGDLLHHGDGALLHDEHLGARVTFRENDVADLVGALVQVAARHGQRPSSYRISPASFPSLMIFVSGADHQCFLPESQARSFGYFNALRPNYSLHAFPHHKHLDPIIGQHAARDIFPTQLGGTRSGRVICDLM